MTQLPLRASRRQKVTRTVDVPSTFGIAILTLIITSIVRADANWYPASIWISNFISLACLLVYQFIRPRIARWKSIATLDTFLTVSFIGWSLIEQATLRRFFSIIGEPNELLMMACLQHAVMFASVQKSHKSISYAGLTAGFALVLFAVTMSSNRILYGFAAAYGLMLSGWLMGQYWDRLRSGFVAAETVPATRLRWGMLVGAIAILALVGWISSGNRTVLGQIAGFMPTSGGNGAYDERARSGIGDGDMMVAAKDQAMSFGPVESDLFLEDTSPSLYDMFSEFYGDKPKAKKKFERAIALAPNLGQENHEKLSSMKKSSREFSTTRQGATQKRTSQRDTSSPALLYLIGEVPLHLALETFDAFDGVDWTHQEVDLPRATLQLENVAGKPQIRYQSPSSAKYFAATSSFGLKVINYKSPRIPSPDNFATVHIDKVDRPDFFAWTQDGVPEMCEREYIPLLTVLKVQAFRTHIHQLRDSSEFSRLATEVKSASEFVSPQEVQEAQLRYDALASSALAPRRFHNGSTGTPESNSGSAREGNAELMTVRAAHNNRPAYLQIPTHHSAIQELANDLTTGVPRGWMQVDAIVDHLRGNFVHDSDASQTATSDDPLGDFLRTQRGPDYLFATSAAMLIRSLGIPTRLATGLYADPDDYDFVSGQTVIRKDNLHTWVQVSIDGKHWISIEPTPGYAKPREHLNVLEAFQLAWLKLRVWIVRNPYLTTFLVLSSVAIIYFRVLVADTFLFLVWATAVLFRRKRAIAWTVWLLDSRSRLVRRARQKHTTLRDWYQSLARSMTSSHSQPFLSLIDAGESWLYAPAHKRMQLEKDKHVFAACLAIGLRITAAKIQKSSSIRTSTLAGRSRPSSTGRLSPS